MEKIVQVFLNDLEAIGYPIYRLTPFDLLDIFHKWLEKSPKNDEKRQEWLRELLHKKTGTLF